MTPLMPFIPVLFAVASAANQFITAGKTKKRAAESQVASQAAQREALGIANKSRADSIAALRAAETSALGTEERTAEERRRAAAGSVASRGFITDTADTNTILGNLLDVINTGTAGTSGLIKQRTAAGVRETRNAAAGDIFNINEATRKSIFDAQSVSDAAQASKVGSFMDVAGAGLSTLDLPKPKVAAGERGFITPSSYTV